MLEEGVARVNCARQPEQPMAFFERFRRDRALAAIGAVPLLEPDLFSSEFVQREVEAGCRRRLVLHGGAPKTGTSSLQWHLAENREELAARGIWFAPPSFSPEPKHQPLSARLRQGDIVGFVRYVEAALADMPDDTHTVILTTEGIFNHWWDYPPEAKGALRRLAALFDFELCLWLREPVPFAVALWQQYLQNPQVEGPSASVQGRDVSLADVRWKTTGFVAISIASASFRRWSCCLAGAACGRCGSRATPCGGFWTNTTSRRCPCRRGDTMRRWAGLASPLVRFVNRHFGDAPRRARALRLCRVARSACRTADRARAA